jgi:hypothetical protein
LLAPLHSKENIVNIARFVVPALEIRHLDFLREALPKSTLEYVAGSGQCTILEDAPDIHWDNRVSEVIHELKRRLGHKEIVKVSLGVILEVRDI